MRFFITGISGFVGQRLTHYLLARGDVVSGTYHGDAPTLPGVEVAAIELGDTAALTDTIAAADPDAVIHLAGLSHVGRSWDDPAAYFRVNVLGTERLLAAAADRRVVFTSSAEVYGAIDESDLPIGEACPPAPLSPYALTKASAERLVIAAGGVVARCFNLLGPGQATAFALPDFARQLAAIERGEQAPVLAVGNLSARRDFVHVDDGAAALALLADRGGSGGIYNIASGRAVELRQLLDRLMVVAGVEARVEVEAERLRPVDVPVMIGDPNRLEALGWQRRNTVDDALADLWRSVRAAGDL